MNFNSNKAIYEQMAERLCDEIIAENYKADDPYPLGSRIRYHASGEHQTPR